MILNCQGILEFEDLSNKVSYPEKNSLSDPNYLD